MSKTFKLHFKFIFVISLIAAIFSSQAISTHAHLAQTNDHNGIHQHDIESHSHGWAEHFSANNLHVTDLDSTVDIDQAVKLPNLYDQLTDLDSKSVSDWHLSYGGSSQNHSTNYLQPIRLKTALSPINPRAPPAFA